MADENGVTVEQLDQAVTALEKDQQSTDETIKEMQNWMHEVQEWRLTTVEKINEVVTGLNVLQRQLDMFMAQCEQVLHGHNVRTNVIEYVLSDEDEEGVLQGIRDRLAKGEKLDIAELQAIGRDMVMPKIQKQAEERMTEIRKAQEEMAKQAGAEGGEAGLVGPDGAPADASADLVTADGRKIVIDRSPSEEEEEEEGQGT